MANRDLIRRSINGIYWENRFSKTDEHQKVYLFDETIKKILNLYYTRLSFVMIAIPHRSIGKLKI